MQLSSRTLKQSAAQRLSQAAYSPRKLILLHTGLSLAVTFVITALSFLLSDQIDSTGGLSGIGLRSMLATIQTALQLGAMIALPFWEIGFQRAALSMGREEPAGPSTLLEGFRRFGPVLRLLLLRILLYVMLIVVCVNVSTGIFLLTPAAKPYIEVMLPLMEDLSVLNSELVLDEAVMVSLAETIWPAYLICGVLLLAVSIPLSYRLRMADFAVLDDQRVGAFFSVAKSWKLTRHNCLRLFRLDLSFWWFYALQLVLTAVAYLDMILPALGISLPAYSTLGFFLLQSVGQLALYWWAGSYVHTTYALAYDNLRTQTTIPVPSPAPKHQPWDHG